MTRRKTCTSDAQCTRNYVCNPTSQLCVKKDGPVGRSIMASRGNLRYAPGHLGSVNLAPLMRKIERERVRQASKPPGSVLGQHFWTLENKSKVLRPKPALRQKTFPKYYAPPAQPVRSRRGVTTTLPAVTAAHLPPAAQWEQSLRRY